MYRRRAPVGGIVGAAMFLFLIALAGSALTLLVYLFAALFALGLAIQLCGWIAHKIERRIDGRRAVRAATAAAYNHFLALDMTHDAAASATRWDVPTLPADMRHPAWAEAVQARSDARLRLVREYLALKHRYDKVSAHRPYSGDSPTLVRLREDMDTVTSLCYRAWGTLPREAGEIAVHGRPYSKTYNVAIVPPAEEVLHLDRSFHQVTDCRYGHAAEHMIVGITGLTEVGLEKVYEDQPRGRIVRECEVCAPVTRWTERP